MAKGCGPRKFVDALKTNVQPIILAPNSEHKIPHAVDRFSLRISNAGPGMINLYPSGNFLSYLPFMTLSSGSQVEFTFENDGPLVTGGFDLTTGMMQADVWIIDTQFLITADKKNVSN